MRPSVYDWLMALSSRTQRSLLYSFILSLSACGLIGILILLRGQFGTLEARVLGSTAAIGVASILAMASAVAAETRRWHPVGPAGTIAVAVALLLVLVLIWELRPRSADLTLERLSGTTTVIAVALSHVALLSLARLHQRFELVRLCTVGVIVVLAGLVIRVIWWEPTDDLWPRLIGVFAILDACGTIAVPILHRVSRIHEREQYVTTPLEVTLTCPRCGVTQTRPTGQSQCACGLKIRIEVEEEHCPKCGYSLYKATSGVCPECGTRVT